MSSEKKVDLQKQVFDKRQYEKTIDTNFSELGVQTVEQEAEAEVTVEQFFQYYDELFYEIPAEGETNSHRYLVIQSGEYINFDEIQEEIQALRDEIAGLRTENLELSQEIVDLQTQVAQQST
jgi:hypothetical protein